MQNGIVMDFYPEQARFDPGEPIALRVELSNDSGHALTGAAAVVALYDLGARVGPDRVIVFDLPGGQTMNLEIVLAAPEEDCRGYLASLRVLDGQGRELDQAVTAVDVSSDWSRFPRYGYVAHFGRGVNAESWVAELNKFHLNGLQFYDFQYKHHRPLAGTAAKPAESWRDIAGRQTSRRTVLAFIEAARKRKMTTMAYNASYSAYADAFRDGSGVELAWAAWNDPAGRRSAETVKSYGPFPPGWSTPKLLFMNQNCAAWQDYLFGRMAELFTAYPFDGWHIDTFGERGAYAHDGSYIDYIEGLPAFADRARERLGRRIVLNTVGGHGQTGMARSRADFVYSELWDEHRGYESLLACADEVRTANPDMAVVLPAYMHRGTAWRMGSADRAFFNTPSVLLADAIIYAAGAYHLELGDGGRMLATEYFADDEKIVIPPVLRAALRRYHDFVVAYQNYLRDGLSPTECRMEILGIEASRWGEPGAVWSFTRAKGRLEVTHLINLLAVEYSDWRDDNADYPDAPLQADVRIRLRDERRIEAVGWASPDVDGGRFRTLHFEPGKDADGAYVEFTLPSLKYWDMVVVRYSP